MTGTSATTFNPKGVTTRAMVVATLYRLAGSPKVTGEGRLHRRRLRQLL